MREKVPVDFHETPLGLRELLEAVPDAVFCCDARGRFQWLNSTIESLTGRSLVSLLGRPFTELLDPRDRTAAARFYSRQQRRRTHASVHLWTLRTENGATRTVSAHVRRHERLDGEVAHVGCLRAVDERTSSAVAEPTSTRNAPSAMPDPSPASATASADRGPVAALERQLAETARERDSARADSRLGNELLHMLAHEIRTPMNSIMGMTHLLLESITDGEPRSILENVQGSSQALITMVNDTLDFSLLQTGGAVIETIDFDLRVTMNEVAAMVAPFAHDRGLRFECRVNHEVPSRLRGDPGRLRQVLFNLAASAIKLNETEGDTEAVRLTVDREREDENDVTLGFAIVQSSPIVPSELLASLQPFLQGEVPLDRGLGGTALGLGISRKLIGLLGGEVGLETATDGGPSLWFRLTVPKQVVSRTPDTAEVQLRGLRVLVVDPSPGTRQSALDMLSAWGCRTDHVTHGAQALARLSEAVVAGDPYRAAIVELQLPDVDGLDLGRRIGSDRALRGTSLMMLTTLGSRGDAARAQAAGYVAYLPKPVGWTELYDALVEMVLRAEGRIDEGAPLITRHSLADARRGRVRVLLVDDDVVNQLVAKAVLSRSGFQVDVANSGQEAIEACERQRYDVILMDVQMSDLDGYATAKALRARERGSRTPIVAMTAGGPSARERCLENGMDESLAKPIDLGELCTIVERWSLGSGTREPGVKEDDDAQRSRPEIASIVAHDPGESSIPVLDLDRLEDSCMGMKELRESLLNAFLNDMRPRLERVSDAVRAEDARRLQFEAHGLRGTCATIGTAACARVFAELETIAREGRLAEAKPMLLRAVAEVERAEHEIREHLRRFGETEDRAAA